MFTGTRVKTSLYLWRDTIQPKTGSHPKHYLIYVSGKSLGKLNRDLSRIIPRESKTLTQFANLSQFADLESLTEQGAGPP